MHELVQFPINKWDVRISHMKLVKGPRKYYYLNMILTKNIYRMGTKLCWDDKVYRIHTKQLQPDKRYTHKHLLAHKIRDWWEAHNMSDTKRWITNTRQGRKNEKWNPILYFTRSIHMCMTFHLPCTLPPCLGCSITSVYHLIYCHMCVYIITLYLATLFICWDSS